MAAPALSSVFRPRHPEPTDFYRILRQHFDEYLSVYEYRSELR